MTLARVHDQAFGLLHDHIRRVGSQSEQAFAHAAGDTSRRLAAHGNDALEEAGLGRPLSVWEHQGRHTVGVPVDHPDADDVWDHEYGTPTSGPNATLRHTFWRLRPASVENFNGQFKSVAFRGTMWGEQ